jgi:RecG-like helicase
MPLNFYNRGGKCVTKLFENIQYLKGVGSARAEKYAKLGIETPYELLYYIPRKYLDYRNYQQIYSFSNLVQSELN